MPKFLSKYAGIISRQHFLYIFKEVFRKSIHLCSAFVPLFLGIARKQTIVLLICAVLLYSLSEVLRLKGINVPLISAITEAAARKRDENKFVLGPVTLCLGILIAATVWNSLPATIGIFALAFGDGLASLSGKLFGRIQIPFTEGKTAAGSLTCFAAIFISCYLACFFNAPENCNISQVSLFVASAGMLIEVLPLRDLDNILIPFMLGGLAQHLIG